mmetsp:Transcript_60107/g.158114  ORF Transcript_60107/g.158114 Transcript_60107/m.158114 type:complete len:490 (+) Transcript_60107:68-1537(+)
MDALFNRAAAESPGDVLGGNSFEVINVFTWSVLGVLAGASVVLYAGQKLQAKVLGIPVRPSHAGVPRTSNWVLFSFMGCYSLLVPGLICPLFSYNLSALGGNVEMAEATHSMLSFIQQLWGTNCTSGALLVVLYAIVVPAIKLVLLLLSEVWRRQGPEQVMKARRCVGVLQHISKWASPDMFAYVLLLFLMRSLNHPPTLQAVSQMDVGFTCFAVFCVGSTVAALGLRMPPLPDGAKEAEPRCFGWMRRPAVQAGIVALLFAAFVPLLIVGLSQPSMSLKVDPNGFFEPNGPLPEMLRPIVMSLGIEEIAHAEVSIWQCMGKLAEWAGSGEANSLIGFILFAVCAVAATIVDMLLLLAAALMTLRRAARPVTPSNEASAPAGRDGAEPLLLVRIAQVLKKLSFLDVAIVGIVVVVLGGQAYRVQGLILSMEMGLVPLFLAETCHYLAYYLVAYAQPSGLDAARSIKLKEGGEPQQGQVSGAPEALAVEV